MIPKAKTDIIAVTEQEQPSRTYKVDFERGRVSGTADGIKAMEQAIFLILNTDRFRHLIYSWSYGNELSSVVGKDTAFAKSEISRLVTEALTQDDRIISVGDFVFSQTDKNDLKVSFTVDTVIGIIKAQTEVSI